MKKSSSKLFLVSLTVFVLSSFALSPVADARGAGGGGGARAGGGGGGGGGGRAAGAGAGASAGTRQASNVNSDVRTNNVRNSSVNNINSGNVKINSGNVNVNSGNVNVNASRNVNVNVNNHGGWDNDYHPVATAVAVTAAAVVIGSMVRTVPAGCVPVNYGGMIYQQCGTVWYQPQGPQYVVINPPY